MQTWSRERDERTVLSPEKFPVCQAISDVKIPYRSSWEDQDIPGIYGIDTRALTKILRVQKGTMNGMITTNENYNLDEILPKLKRNIP